MNEPRQTNDTTQRDRLIAEDPRFKQKYEFLDTIGFGGMGVIYKVRQIAIDKIVAVKMLHSNVSSDAAFGRFQREAKAASLLSNKYIVGVHDLGATTSGQPFLVMDYVDGKTLAQDIIEHGPLHLDRFLRIMLQITNALQHAHENGVLHRDLKPSNIMLVPNDKGQEEVRILDFGIAKLMSSEYSGQQLTKTGETIGSPLYMSPEQGRSGDVDQRSDLYSLGCVMYEAATGTPPFVGKTALETIVKHLEEAPLPMVQASLGLEIDAGLQDIVSRLLAKAPADRYQTASMLEHDLRQLQDATIGGKTARFIYTPQSTPLSRKGKVPLWSLVLAGGTTLTVLGAVVWHILAGKTAPTDTALAPQFSQVLDVTGTDAKQLIKSTVAHGDKRINLKKMQQGMRVILSITDDDLSPLEDAVKAEEIDFPAAVHITDAGLAHVKNLKLKSLSVQGTEVRTLSALKNMTSLVRLDVSQSFIDSSGVAVITGLHNLQFLNLSNTSITDSDMNSLKSLKNLRCLLICDCSHISEAAIQSFRAGLPHCTIASSGSSQVLAEEENGRRLVEHEKYKEADKQFAAALQRLARRVPPDYSSMAVCLGKRSECNVMLGNYRKSADLIEKQLDCLKRCKNTELWIASVEGLQAVDYEALAMPSNGKIDQKLLAKAIADRERAAACYDSRDPTNRSLPENLHNLANDYRAQGHSDHAIQILENLMPHYKQLKTERSLQAAIAMHNLADLYIGKGEFQQALPYYEQAGMLYEKLVLPPDVHQALWLNQARCYISLNQPQKAEACLKTALTRPCKTGVLRQAQYAIMVQALRAENVPASDERIKQYSANIHRLENTMPGSIRPGSQ